MTVIIVIIENTLTRLLVGVQIRLLADAGGLLSHFISHREGNHTNM